MRIQLNNIRLKSYHGIYERERIEGNLFSVDVAFDLDARKAAISDNIGDTVNYEDIYAIVRHEMDITANLLENVAQRICKKIEDSFDNIDNIHVAVSKYNPFGDGNVEKVTVETNSPT